MITLGDEDDLLEDVKEGVDIAMHRRGFDDGDVDPIKFNKLAYFAVEEFDLPITYGWYKYGPAPVNTASQSVDVSPVPSNDVPAADEPRVQDVNHDNRSPEEYSYFFSDDLEEFERIVKTSTKEYLVEFYFNHAPDRYRDLYIASAELQQIVDEITSDPSWHEDAGQFLEIVETRYPRIVREVRSNPALGESVRPVESYERLLIDVLETASNRTELSEAQQRFVGRIIDFFYGGAWKYVALLISRDTVELSPGTNQDRLRNSIDEDLREIRTGYETELNRLWERGERYELVSHIPKSDGSATREDRIRTDDGDEFDTANTASLQELREELE